MFNCVTVAAVAVCVLFEKKVELIKFFCHSHLVALGIGVKYSMASICLAIVTEMNEIRRKVEKWGETKIRCFNTFRWLELERLVKLKTKATSFSFRSKLLILLLNCCRSRTLTLWP